MYEGSEITMGCEECLRGGINRKSKEMEIFLDLEKNESFNPLRFPFFFILCN